MKLMSILVVSIGINVVFSFLSVQNEVFPYRTRVDKTMADVAKSDQKPYVHKVFGFFLDLQQRVRGLELFVPEMPWITQNDKMGLRFAFYLEHVAGLKFSSQTDEVPNGQDSPGEILKLHHKRVFEEAVEFHYDEEAKKYVLIPGDPVRILPLESP